MGIRDVTLATAYHAGKFIRPHARVDTCDLPRGWRITSNQIWRYENSTTGAQQASTKAVVGDLINDGRARACGPVVLLHHTHRSNIRTTRLKNAFGDSYMYMALPMQDAVFDYAVHLCSDLASQYAFSSLVLETPGWLPYGHGCTITSSAQVATNPWLDSLLGTCFAMLANRRLVANLQIDFAFTGSRQSNRLNHYLALPSQNTIGSGSSLDAS